MPRSSNSENKKEFTTSSMKRINMYNNPSATSFFSCGAKLQPRTKVWGADLFEGQTDAITLLIAIKIMVFVSIFFLTKNKSNIFYRDQCVSSCGVAVRQPRTYKESLWRGLINSNEQLVAVLRN